MKKFFARLLCVLLSLQGYPLLALQETGVRAVPNAHALGLVEDWVSSAAHETSTWTDSLRETASEWVKSLEETASIAAFVADGAQGAGSASGGGAPVSGVSSSSEEGNERPRLQALEDTEKETTSRKPTSLEVSPRLRLVDKKARVEKAPIIDASAKSSAIAPASTPRQVIPKTGVAPEISALAQSLGSSPGRIFRFVHDEIDCDPKWGVGKSPLGTLYERQGTAWDQAWLLQQLLTAAGVDARFEWGEIEITPELLKNVTGVDDPFRAGDLLTTAGVPIVLLVDGSRVVAARMSHVWVKAFLDYIPNRGATPGPGDKWIRMDPSLKRFDVGAGVRLDEAVPFDLGEYLQSGTLLSPRSYYEESLQSYVDANNVGVTSLDELKPAKSLIQEAFPFVPASLRGKILTVAGESPDVPVAFQQQLEVQVREVGGAGLLTWSTPWPAVYGKRLELAWLGATSADQSALDLNGGVFATPPYEVDLRPVLRVDGAEVASGETIGSAEDVELTATLTPSAGSPMVAQFEMFAGEHAILAVDFGQIPAETVARFTAERDAATAADEHEAWALALAGAVYMRSLNGDLEHLSALRYRRVVELGTIVLAAQRGAASRAPDGTPLTFSAAPPSLDQGSMVLGLFPADGDAGPASTSVSTLELLGSQGSAREGEALAQALGGEHLTAVGFLTRAAREGQTLTRVDATNVDAALAAAELSSAAELSLRAGVDRGLIAWISQTQLPFDTWDATGYVLEDPATGAGGYFVTFERLVQGLEASIVFHSPQDLDVVTAPIDVVATLEGEEIDRWTLAYRAADGGPAVELASGTGPFVNATLAQFDPTLLLNGMHDIVLTARDAAGQMASQKITVAVAGGMKIGHFTLSFVDLVVPLAGVPVEIVRTYDSRRRYLEGDFGFGWILDVRQGSYRNNRLPGDGWQIQQGFLPCQVAGETRSHLTTIRLSDREVYRFRTRLTRPAVTGGGCLAAAGFEFVDGPVSGATLEALGNTGVFWANGSDEVIDIETFVVYEPRRVRLTTRDGRVFDLDLEEGIKRIADTNGNELTINQSGITHSSGEAVVFTRDTQGRIIEITDPMGETLRYSYDLRDDLISFEDRNNSTSTYAYADGHYLEDLFDPRGIRSVRNEYDADGRLARHIDAAGNEITYDHQLGANREILTNRLGLSRLLEYDARGNVVREVDEAGQETLRTFDGEDNLLTETNPLGDTTTYTYTAGNDLASVRDPLGNTTSFTYDSGGRLLTETDPRGKVTTNTYDGAGNLLTTTDALGSEASFTYDGQGNLLTATDPTGAVTAYVYDSRGNLTSLTDALGTETTHTYDGNGNRLTEATSRTLPDGSTETLVWTFAYDADGRRVTSTEPTGAVTTIHYNALGQMTGELDALGRLTESTYDALGRLVQTDYPDGTVESRAYDAEGRVVSTFDRGGRETTYVYDNVGRLIETHFPDGAVRSQTYDAAARVVSTTDERGNVTTSEYDAAGFRTKAVDALGLETVFVNDTAGNEINVTDGNGHTASFIYDDLNRLATTTFPDGSSSSIAYDAAGRRIRVTDQAGGSTQFGYDALGRLTSVTDALSQVMSFAWDEQGNRVSQTDANGHTTRFEYDSLRRQIARILPDGAREAMAHDAVGNRVSHTDFQGRTTSWAYDAADRPVTRTRPGAATISYTYTDTGRRASVTDSRGTTRYSYDSRDRLVEMAYPDARRLTYAYDLAGNRTSLTAHLASGAMVVTSYTWDELNRLDTVVDAGGRIYGHSYDAVGNRASLDYPNGVSTTYQYDALNRLTHIASEHTASATTIASYAYTLGPAGNRTRIDEHDGIAKVYGYDALYRLTSEDVTADSSLVYRNTFVYDPVGNRLEQGRTAADGTTTTATSTYDDRDRLLTADGTAYGWDANGNLTARGADGFAWDVEGCLAEATLEDGTIVKQTYDADGVRVRTETTDPSTGETVTVDYLVDTSGPLSHVVAETEGYTGLLLAHYVRGDDLLAIVRPTGIRFYHADGLESIRALTDETGAVTDRYQFEAFGILLEHVGDDPNAYLFAGEPLDPNIGFAYHRARWMDPGVGRFASSDPLLGNPYDPRSLHRYTYAFDDPINVIDPSGEESLVGFAITQAIIGALVSFVITFAFTRNLEKSLYSALGGFVIGFFVGGAFYWLRGLLAARSAATAAAAAGVADDVVIAADKLRYLLQLDPGKAKGFAQLGYTLENADDLANVLRYSRTLIGEGTAETVTQFGTKYEVVIKVIGANGREGLIEIVWQVDKGTSLYRLITAIAKPF